MARWVDVMFTTTGTVSGAETAMASYVPTRDAKLIAVIVDPLYTAGTSVIEGGYIKLACPTFGGIDLICRFKGSGVGTAPRAYIEPAVTLCDLEVQAGTPIRGWYFYNTTPTTPYLIVYGVFESQG